MLFFIIIIIIFFCFLCVSVFGVGGERERAGGEWKRVGGRMECRLACGYIHPTERGESLRTDALISLHDAQQNS